ncbi:MAG: heme ABC transporter ATP-binding protein [Candidatus Geothermarchaeales archaeon]
MRLEVDGIAFNYESSPILEDITFQVDQGEFLGIMGPNGSGKTTLLRCMCNVLKPRVGTVLIDKQDIQRLSRREIARKVGVVPQGPSVDFAFTALEIVLMGRNPHVGRLETEGKRDFEVVRWAMELTNTLHLAERVFDELSGGEKQRVIIARALAQEPKVLLLDEPTVHLDINYQLEILELVKRLNKQNGIIVVAVFHDLNLASRYCDKLILLSDGRIASMGLPDEVLTPENIQKIYNVDVLVKRHPLTNAPYVTPYISTGRARRRRDVTVHVVCGGGSGAQLMKRLLDEGFEVTAGILNVLDTDYEIARDLGISVIGEVPFSQITQGSFEAHIRLIKEADVVVLTDFPVGPGNLKNIEAAEKALDNGIPLIIVESTPIQERDFTGVELKKHFDRLKDKEAMVVGSINEALRAVDVVCGG